MAATGKRRYWYAAEWPYGRDVKHDDGSDAIALWRFESRSTRDTFVHNGSTLFKSNETARTTYSGVAARKRSYVYEMLPDGSDYQVVEQ